MDAAIARKLLQIRRARNLSQYAMAQLLDMKRSTYAGYEAGTRAPGLDTIDAIARRLNISPGWFLERDETESTPGAAGWHQSVAVALRNAGWSEERVRLAIRLIQATEEESDQ